MTGKRFAKQLDRVTIRLIVALAGTVIVFSDWTAAQAFDFFGLFGSDDTPPPISRASIPYTLTVEVAGDQSALKDAVKDASSLYRLRKDAPPDGEALARRAESDFAPVIDALWGAGYYNAAVTIAIDGATLPIGSSDIAAFARAAEAYRNRSAAPVVIKVDPGPLFKLRSVRVVDALGVEFPEAELPQRIVGLKPGDPAAASEIRAAETRIIDYFRKQGRPLAKIQSVAPVVDHAQAVMDVTVMAAPAPSRRSAKRRSTGRRLSIPRSCARFSISIRATPIRRRRSPTRGTASAKFLRSAACASPKGRRSTPMAACPIRSTSRIACHTRSARQ